jgi:hypothetical protein
MSISVVVYDALPGDPSASSRAFSDNLAARMNSYTHNISVDGGYTDMSIDFSGTADEIQFWYEQGLGRKIETRSPEGNKIWEGFINEISIRLGGLSMSVGPVVDMANRVYVTYTGKKWIAWGVTFGGKQETTDAGDDTDSQDKFGIMEEYVSGGSGTETEMETLRDAHLADRAKPFVSQAQIDSPGGSPPSVSLSCIGYWALFEKYTYSSGATTSSDISDKIQAVVAGDPSTRFSTNYTGITANTLEVPDVEEDQKTAASVLKELISYGDTSNKRYTIGVYNDRMVHYAPIEEVASYVYSISSPDSYIKDINSDTVIQPWNVLPGKWLIVSGLTTSQTPVGDLTKMRNSPAAMFIESVSFSTPYSVSIQSGPTATFAQKLARLGVGLQ